MRLLYPVEVVHSDECSFARPITNGVPPVIWSVFISSPAAAVMGGWKVAIDDHYR